MSHLEESSGVSQDSVPTNAAPSGPVSLAGASLDPSQGQGQQGATGAAAAGQSGTSALPPLTGSTAPSSLTGHGHHLSSAINNSSNPGTGPASNVAQHPSLSNYSLGTTSTGATGYAGHQQPFANNQYGSYNSLSQTQYGSHTTGGSSAYHYGSIPQTSHSYVTPHGLVGQPSHEQMLYNQQLSAAYLSQHGVNSHLSHGLSIRGGQPGLYGATGVAGDDGEGELDAKGMRVVRVKRACSNCKSAKTKCDNERPCRRCTRTGRVASCVDSVHKKRGRKRTGLPGDENGSDSDTGDEDINGMKRDSLTPGKRSKSNPRTPQQLLPQLDDLNPQYRGLGVAPGQYRPTPPVMVPNASPNEWASSLVSLLKTQHERWAVLIANMQATTAPSNDPSSPLLIAQRANAWLAKWIEYHSRASVQDEAHPLDEKERELLDKKFVFTAQEAETAAQVEKTQQQVYGSLPIGVSLLSFLPLAFHPSSRFPWMNPAGCNLLGYTALELSTLLRTVHGWSTIYHSHNLPTWVVSFVDAIHRGVGNYSLRARFIRKDRTQIELFESVNISYLPINVTESVDRVVGNNTSGSGIPVSTASLLHPVDQPSNGANTVSTNLSSQFASQPARSNYDYSNPSMNFPSQPRGSTSTGQQYGSAPTLSSGYASNLTSLSSLTAGPGALNSNNFSNFNKYPGSTLTQQIYAGTSTDPSAQSPAANTYLMNQLPNAQLQSSGQLQSTDDKSNIPADQQQ